MLERTDFNKKQMVFYFPTQGDKLSFRNDNIVIKDSEGTIKIQATCYRIFILFIVGDTTITTGVLNRSSKFGFSICLMNRNMKIYKYIGSRMEGNTFLRKHQYTYDGTELAQYIILNKITNQRNALNEIRSKNQLIKEAISKLDGYCNELRTNLHVGSSLLGIEGSASRVYFSQMFDYADWKGRKPRIKPDFINASLDIGYTILFNIIDSLLNVDSAKYTKIYLTEIMNYKDELFLYIQSYYRAFMKQRDVGEFPAFIFKGGINGIDKL